MKKNFGKIIIAVMLFAMLIGFAPATKSEAVCNIFGGTYSMHTDDHEGTIVKNAVEVTCTEAGYTGDVYCEVCNQLLEIGTTIPATVHHPMTTAEEENRIDATCTETGSYEIVVYCDDCGDEVSRTLHTIPATGHKTEVIPGTLVKLRKRLLRLQPELKRIPAKPAEKPKRKQSLS